MIKKCACICRGLLITANGPQETMFKDLNQDQILTMFKEQCQRVGTKFVETTPDKLGETILAAIRRLGQW